MTRLSSVVLSGTLAIGVSVMSGYVWWVQPDGLTGHKIGSMPKEEIIWDGSGEPPVPGMEEGEIVQRQGIGEPDQLIAVHGILMAVAWLAISAGVGVAHFMAKATWWFKVHAVTNLFGLAFLVTGFVLAVMMTASGQHLQGTHAQIGVATAVLFVAQPFLGFAADMLYNPRRRSIPFFPDRVHRYIGRLVLFGGFGTLYTGLSAAGANTLYTILIGVWAVLMIGAVIVKDFIMPAPQSRGGKRGKGRSGGRNDNSSVSEKSNQVALNVNYFGSKKTFMISSTSSVDQLIVKFKEAFPGLDGTVVGVYKHGDVVVPVQLLPSYLKRIDEGAEYFLAITNNQDDPDVKTTSGVFNRISRAFGSRNRDTLKSQTRSVQYKAPERNTIQADKDEHRHRSRSRGRTHSTSRKHSGHDTSRSKKESSKYDDDDEDSNFRWSEKRNTQTPLRLSVYGLGGVRQQSLYLSQG